MAHIAYVTTGMTSPLHRSFELARRLVAAGHRVTILSGADVEAKVSAQGYPFVPFSSDRRLRERAAADAAPRWSWRRPSPGDYVRWVRRRRALRRASIENDEIERAVDGLAPDVLLIDVEMHFAIIATARLGIPTLLAVGWFTFFRHSKLPPLHSRRLPAAGPVEHAAVWWSWWRTRAANHVNALATFVGRRSLWRSLQTVAFDTGNHRDLRAVAAARGYDFRKETDASQWLRPFLSRNLPMLCFNAFELEFPHEPHPNLRYVGPMVHTSRRETDQRSGARWQAFERNRSAKEARPLVYASLGTFWAADRGFLERVLSVFERRPDWDLVLGLGGKLAPGELAEAPSNALVLEWAPQLSILRVADCSITHGGVSSINEALYFGVPIVVYSTGFAEQNGNAARVAYHEVGVVGDKSSDGVDELEQKVERALTDASIRANVDAMRERFRDYEREGRAVRLIEEHAARRAPNAR